jgi:type VII secretion protein EccE
VAAWEVAALAVVFAVGRATPVKEAAVALAAVVLLSTSVRIGGCCLSQWAYALVCYRHRRRRPAPQSGYAQPLTALVPDLRLRQHVDRAGNRVGLALCDGSLTAVVRLAPATRPDPRTLLAVLRDAFASTTVPLAGAQVVVWTVAGPAQPPDRMPEPVRVYWLALRYRPGQAPQAAQARGGGEVGAMRAAASAAFSLTMRLDEAGYASAVLDRVALSRELMVAVGAKANAAQASVPGLLETWGSWSAAGLRQMCYRPDRSLNPATLLGRWVPGAAFSCVSYTLGRTPWGHVRSDVVVRLGASTANGERRPAPGSAFGSNAVPMTGRHYQYARQTLPLAIGQ